MKITLESKAKNLLIPLPYNTIDMESFVRVERELDDNLSEDDVEKNIDKMNKMLEDRLKKTLADNTKVSVDNFFDTRKKILKAVN
jgi:hypothetical protein